jgi:hypothetical protein
MSRLERGQKLEPLQMQFVLANGGVGDYINWSVALNYVIEKYEHLHGYIVIANHGHALDLFKLLFTNPRFEVVKDPVPGVPLQFPKPGYPDVQGFHPIDLGFMLYANRPTPSFYKRTPRLDFSHIDISRFGLAKDYVVIVPGMTAKSRAIRPTTVNKLTEYFRLRGYEVVFLGASEHGHKTNFHPDLDKTNVKSLINRTSILEAGAVIQGAKCIVGNDGGLIHVAATTNTPIVAGMTVASPEKRTPYRTAPTRFVVPKIDCIFCQEENFMVTGHDYKDCLYGDSKCCDLLTPDLYIKEIEQVL